MRLQEILTEGEFDTLLTLGGKRRKLSPEQQANQERVKRRPNVRSDGEVKSQPKTHTGPKAEFGDPAKRGTYKKKKKSAKKKVTVNFKLQNWPVMKSNKFKKGYNKHRNNKAVLSSMKNFLGFVDSSSGVPALSDYPQEFNVHPITKDRNYAGYMLANLQGQKIRLLFSMEGGTLKLAHLGTPQEINPNWF